MSVGVTLEEYDEYHPSPYFCYNCQQYDSQREENNRGAIFLSYKYPGIRLCKKCAKKIVMDIQNLLKD